MSLDDGTADEQVKHRIESYCRIWNGRIFDINEIPKLPQRQDSVMNQLNDLVQVANKLGMYDAADLIRISLLKDNV